MSLKNLQMPSRIRGVKFTLKEDLANCRASIFQSRDITNAYSAVSFWGRVFAMFVVETKNLYNCDVLGFSNRFQITSREVTEFCAQVMHNNRHRLNGEDAHEVEPRTLAIWEVFHDGPFSFQACFNILETQQIQPLHPRRCSTTQKLNEDINRRLCSSCFNVVYLI